MLRHTPVPARFRYCVALLGPACLLAGCSDRGAEAQAIAESARHLGAVGSGSVSDNQYTYASVSQELNRLDVGQGPAASIVSGLLSQSRQGEGSLKANQAILAERALFDEIDKARTLARQWTALSTTATSLASFDPSDDIAQITVEAEDLAREANQRREDQARLMQQFDELESRVESLRAESDEKRNRAAQMKLEAAAFSAVDAAAQAVTIRTLTREADALDMQANRLSGQIETLRPRLDEIEGEVQKLIEQRELALAFADELRASQQDRNERAVRARAKAAAIAEQIGQIMSDIFEQRQTAVIPVSQEAVSDFEQASRASDKAIRGHRSSGQLAKASAQRRLGEVLHFRAQGHGRYAALLEELASTTPPLPEADTWRDQAVKEREAQADHLDRAADAYEQVASSLRSTGIRGEQRDGLEAAADEFDALARRLRGEPDPIAEPNGSSLHDPPPEP